MWSASIFSLGELARLLRRRLGTRGENLDAKHIRGQPIAELDSDDVRIKFDFWLLGVARNQMDFLYHLVVIGDILICSSSSRYKSLVDRGLPP